MHSFLVEVQTNKCWPHKCQACVLATRKLGLRAPLVARSNHEVYTVTNTYQPIGGVAKCRLFSRVSICVHFMSFFSRLLSFQGHTDENRYTSFSSLYLGLTEEILNEEHLARLQLYKAKCFHWQIKKQAEMKLTKREAKRSGKGFNSENTAVHRNVSKGENRTTSRS